MTIIVVILLTLIAAISFSFLSRGSKDKEFKQREAFWSKYEGK